MFMLKVVLKKEVIAISLENIGDVHRDCNSQHKNYEHLIMQELRKFILN